MPVFLQNATIAMESIASRTTAVDIDSITNANPGVVGHSGTDPTNGDIVILNDVLGMRVDNRVARVANVNAGSDTFELEGLNTTDLGTYNTTLKGNFQVVTLDITIGQYTFEGSSSGGEFDTRDQTTFADEARVSVPGLASEITTNLTLDIDMPDNVYNALRDAYFDQTTRVFQISAGNVSIYFAGRIGFTGGPSNLAFEERIGTQAVITQSSSFTRYLS